MPRRGRARSKEVLRVSEALMAAIVSARTPGSDFGLTFGPVLRALLKLTKETWRTGPHLQELLACLRAMPLKSGQKADQLAMMHPDL